MSEKRIVLAALKIGFSLTLAQFQAGILLCLCLYWLFTRWESITERFSPENLGPTMLGVIITFGMFVGTMFFLDWGTEYALLAVTLACSVVLALCDPAISVCVFVCLLFMRPWEIIADNDYFAILPRMTMSICVINLLVDMVRRRRFKLQWNQTSTALIGFAVWLLVTTMKSGPDAQAYFMDTFFKNCFLFMIVMNLVHEKEELDLVAWTIVITMFGVGLASIVQTLDYREQAILAGADSNSDEMRLVGFGAFENSNDIAALMVMVMPFCFVPAIKKGSHWLARIVGIIGLGMVVWSLGMAMSRGAQLGVVAIIGVYALIRMKNRKHAMMLAAGAFLLVTAASQLSARNEADLDESKRFRMIYLQTGIVMGMKNPVMGVGFNGYADNFTTYQTGEVDGTTHRTAHNSWVLAFAETGVPGIIMFVSIFASALLAAWSIRLEQPQYLLALVGYGIAMTFLSHTYFIYPYLLYAMTGIAARTYGVAKKAPVTLPVVAEGVLAGPDPLPQT